MALRRVWPWPAVAAVLLTALPPPAYEAAVPTVPDASKALVHGTFALTEPSEVTAVVTASCETCAWGVKGREAAILGLRVDGRYSQDLPLAQGRGPAEYRVLLGRLAAGAHTLDVAVDPLSAPGAKAVSAEVAFEVVAEGAPEHAALAHAPVLHQRPNAVGRFTDVPLLMYYEIEALPSGTRLDYSVVFSNEDGGTPPDRLMATWGRLTDIELAYSVELDAKGGIVREVYQGKDHEMLAFSGRREARHPLLWVVTDNNMLSNRGRTTRRHRPAPQRFDLRGVSREAVMDAHPWTYRVSSEEAAREGRVDEAARPGSEKVPDPRRFAYLEACAEVKDAQVAFDAGVRRSERLDWIASDAGQPRYRVSRGGCFRAAVALPPETPPEAVRSIRVRAHTRPPAKGEQPLPPGTGRARLTRVNGLFLLAADYTPGPRLLRWTGAASLDGDGPPLELTVAPR